MEPKAETRKKKSRTPAGRAAHLSWPGLVPGVLLQRYKRFLADVQLSSGRRATAHCPNSGSMASCCEPGRTVYLSRHDNPKRKLPYTWELIEMPASLVGINTQVPNRLVFRATTRGAVPELAGYADARREVKVSDRSRIDLVLQNGDSDRCFVEVKNCTLVENGAAYFPDAITARGLKHLRELEALMSTGHRCVMFYLIQRMDADVFRPADHIDPEYGRRLRHAVKCGLEILAYDVMVDLKSIAIHRRLPCEL